MDLYRFQELFFSLLQAAPKDSLADRLGMSQEAEISHFMNLCPLQDPFRFRARYLGLKIANLLIDEKGELDQSCLAELNRLFEKGSYFLGPGRENDLFIYRHLQNCLLLLAEKKEIWTWIRKFSPPLCHKRAEELIRETLWPEPIRAIQLFHIRRAVLSAWLTYLRQTTGSCFATAPAILIQQNHPYLFFKDLYDLLTTGRLRRILGGKEYTVPLSLSWGKGDLQKPLGSFSKENLAYSPGMIAALDAAGIFSPGASFSEKSNELRRHLTQLELPVNAEKLIHTLLLGHMGITDEDLEDEKYLSRIQMTPLLAKQTAVYYQKPSERALKVSDWKKRLSKATLAFQSVTECALLRTWEYTIASFCDVKVDFARWNLYVGLGLQIDQKGGIGAFLYAQINVHLARQNEEIEKCHREYETALHAYQSAEAMFRSASSEASRTHFKSDMANFSLAANRALEQRNQAAEKAEAIAGFFSSLMNQIDQKLQEYFQELFDPSLLGDETHLYDDSMAGFRLVYKHGRADASQWTLIYTAEEYISCLRDFFSTVEADIQRPSSIGSEFVSEITTALIQFIQDPEFLKSALERAKEKGRKSPWDYISGGTMQTLLQGYCNRNHPFTESKIVPHSEEDLLRFLEREGVGKKEPLLMHSPTHAFIFYPTLLPTSASALIEQNRKEMQKWKFDEEMQEYLAHRLSDRLPSAEKALFLHLFRQRPTTENPSQFRLNLIDALQSIKDSRVRNRVALVDSLFFETSPLLRLNEAKAALRDILKPLAVRYGLSSLGFESALKQWNQTFVGPHALHSAAKAILLESIRNPVSSVDWDLEIVTLMRSLRLCFPHLGLFADTNWGEWFFGFIVNPVTGVLELWRLNRICTQGFPMSDWKEWLIEKNTAQWILLPKANEYFETM